MAREKLQGKNPRLVMTLTHSFLDRERITGQLNWPYASPVPFHRAKLNRDAKRPSQHRSASSVEHCPGDQPPTSSNPQEAGVREFGCFISERKNQPLQHTGRTTSKKHSQIIRSGLNAT